MKTYDINRLSNLHLIAGLLLILVIYAMPNHAVAKVSAMNVSFQVFYDELTPYGDWVSDPTHGYVWIPYVNANFQPYQTNGYWVNSRFGNTWVSLYEWGWAPFHYGRWFFTDYYGWAWVPGYEWAPAWVSWRTGQGYYGWAPLWPSLGVHVSVGIPWSSWVFVPRRRFLARNIYNYYLPQRNITVIYNSTTVINNTYVYNNRSYDSGPSRVELQRVTRRNVPVYEVSNGTRPGSSNVENNRVQIYRPQLESTNSRRNAQNARPARAYTTDEYASRRNGTSSTRSTEAASNQRRLEQSNSRLATVPRNTNLRTVDLSTRHNRNTATSGSRVDESRSQLPDGRRTVGRNTISPRNSSLSDNGKNESVSYSIGGSSSEKRQRSVATSPPKKGQPAISNQMYRGEAQRANERGTIIGQRQADRPTQGNVGITSPSRVRYEKAPTSQRQVTAPSSRNPNGTSTRSSRVGTNSLNQRQYTSQPKRSQVHSSANSQSVPKTRSLSSGSQNRPSVQAPRQSRTSQENAVRPSVRTNRRGN